MSRLTKSDLDALAFVGLYDDKTTPETIDSYCNYLWDRDTVCEKLSITRTIFARLYVGDYEPSPRGALYCPLTVAKYIQQLLKKRGRNETLRDFAEHVVTRNKVARKNKFQDRKTSAILEVILDLTRGKPNAYKAFDVALRKVGVFLPPQKE